MNFYEILNKFIYYLNHENKKAIFTFISEYFYKNRNRENTIILQLLN